MNFKTTYGLFATLLVLLGVAAYFLLVGTKPGDETLLLPAGKALAERLAGMGQIKWRIDAVADYGPATVQLMVRHPNNSGLAMDQLTRLYDPPHYVRSVRVTRQEELVFSADVDFSISENPSFRFGVKPGFDTDLRAVVTDSNDLTFESLSSVLR